MGDSETSKGAKGRKRPNVDRSAQRKPLLHFWFKILLLFCVVAFILCYTFYWASFPFQKHYQRFISWKKQSNPNPPYKVHWKHSARLNHTYETSPNEIQETKPNNIQETKPRNSQETKPGNSQETKSSNIQETKSSNIQETKSSNIQETKSSNIQETKPRNSQETKSSNIQETKPRNSQETKPGNSQETKSSNIQETKSSNIQETKPRNSQETKPGNSQETKSSNIQETKSSNIQETKSSNIQETKSSNIQETKPSNIQETTPSKIQVTTPAKHLLPTVPPVQYHQAYPHNYHFIMDNIEVCKTKKPFLVLMVPVAPSNVAARDAIRQTWGNSSLVQGKVVLTLFMLGLPSGADIQQQQEKLKQENQMHLDLIQSDFRDSYLNLTIKTMVIMDWLATRCPAAAYAMKIDSDMFLNIDNLMLMLEKPGIPKTNYLTGMLMWNRPVIRSKNSKWYVPEELYPDAQYPTYALGMGYVFSNDLPERFVQVSKSIKPFNIEDAYIGMCMKKLGFPLTPPPDAGQFRAYNTEYNRCEYSKIITYILGSSQQLVKYWTDLKKPGPAC